MDVARDLINVDVSTTIGCNRFGFQLLWYHLLITLYNAHNLIQINHG